jgi:hypothetical protein
MDSKYAIISKAYQITEDFGKMVDILDFYEIKFDKNKTLIVLEK